jgi:uncharacterized membrane protein YecN with MAPEG domain
MSDYDEPIVTSRNALVLQMHEIEALKKELQALKNQIKQQTYYADHPEVKLRELEDAVRFYDSISPYYPNQYMSVVAARLAKEMDGADKKHAQTLLKVLEGEK